VDSTGLESRHCSAYYTRRCQRHHGHLKHRYPKLSAVVDTRSHLFLAAVVDRGPRPDDLEFHRVVLQARVRMPFQTLLADAGYDAEPHHVFLERLGIRGIIPPARGRPLKNPRQTPGGRHRAALARRWPKRHYGQRWQIETDFSMIKRLLGSAVRARRRYTTDREILLRVLTINLMILWRRLALHLFSTEQDMLLFS
jgi:Transposase DDE domain